MVCLASGTDKGKTNTLAEVAARDVLFLRQGDCWRADMAGY